MNYAEMSDAHIAAEVLKIKHGKIGFIALYETHAKLIRDDETFSFDLNDPLDAWLIIVENGICITSPAIDVERWRAMIYTSNKNYSWSDKNPLRAAMIVFLMMNEDK